MANNGLSAAALVLAAGKSGGGGGEPSQYIKNASVNDNTLTLTKKDNTTVEFTPENTEYTAGTGILISNDTISVDEEVISSVEYVDANITDTMNYIIQEDNEEKAARIAGDNLRYTKTESDAKYQDKLTAGTNITISNNVISATGGAVDSVNGQTGVVVLAASDINATNAQSIQANLERIDEEVEGCIDDIADLQTNKQDTLIAGTNITIDENNVISATGGGTPEWGNITGDIEDQDDLQHALGNKVDKGVIVGTNDGTNWTSITLESGTYAIPQGGGSEPNAYLKSASVSNNTLTLTKKDDTTVTFTPDSGTEVSGTNDGTNWTSITIDDDTYAIPSGGGSSYTFTNGLTETDGVVSWDLNDRVKVGGSSQDHIYSLVLGNKGSKVAYQNGLAGGAYNAITAGNNSLAFGSTLNVSTAKGIKAGNVFGQSSTTRQGGDIAIGFVDNGDIIASGNGSFACGFASASSDGYGVRATADGSMACGSASNNGSIIASGGGSFAKGVASGVYKLESSGRSSIAIGDASSEVGSLIASGDASFAQGRGVQATGFGSVAHGYKSVASGNYATANGFDTKAAGANQFVIGKRNVADSAGNYSFIIGNGESDANRKNILTVDWSGNITANNIPAPPTSDGNYVLKCSIVDGVATYSWVAE